MLILLAAAVIVPLSARAQSWNTEQMEVWKALESCWNATTIEGAEGCIHDDYRSFQEAKGVPLNKKDLLANWAHGMETTEPLWVYRKPLGIDVRGDVAVVLYTVTFQSKSRTTGAETTGTYNWTEVFAKDGGVWKALTDHGTKISGD